MAALNNPNLAILELVAQALGPVCESVIFVGGCATGLLLTQERPDRIRVTEDVDIVAQALTVHDYHAIEKQVRARGFSNDMRPDAPICRWVYKNVTLDLMPTVKDIITVADRRPELLAECQSVAPELRAYLAAEFAALFSDPEFEQALSGHLPGDAFSQQRAKPLANTLRELSKLST